MKAPLIAAAVVIGLGAPLVTASCEPRPTHTIYASEQPYAADCAPNPDEVPLAGTDPVGRRFLRVDRPEAFGDVKDTRWRMDNGGFLPGGVCFYASGGVGFDGEPHTVSVTVSGWSGDSETNTATVG